MPESPAASSGTLQLTGSATSLPSSMTVIASTVTGSSPSCTRTTFDFFPSRYSLIELAPSVDGDGVTTTWKDAVTDVSPTPTAWMSVSPLPAAVTVTVFASASWTTVATELSPVVHMMASLDASGMVL